MKAIVLFFKKMTIYFFGEVQQQSKYYFRALILCLCNKVFLDGLASQHGAEN